MRIHLWSSARGSDQRLKGEIWQMKSWIKQNHQYLGLGGEGSAMETLRFSCSDKMVTIWVMSFFSVTSHHTPTVTVYLSCNYLWFVQSCWSFGGNNCSETLSVHWWVVKINICQSVLNAYRCCLHTWQIAVKHVAKTQNCYLTRSSSIIITEHQWEFWFLILFCSCLVHVLKRSAGFDLYKWRCWSCSHLSGLLLQTDNISFVSFWVMECTDATVQLQVSAPLSVSFFFLPENVF